jgi:hypothetical protein
VAARQAVGQTAGTYHLCFYAYTPFSARITISEQEGSDYVTLLDDQIHTVALAGRSFVAARYQNTAFGARGSLRVFLEAQGLADDEAPPELYYAVCRNPGSGACDVDDDSFSGAGRSGRLCQLGRTDDARGCGAE